jgi:DNA-binding SARP family transcriptional activator/tetratricopeptide (TPR) repeat protein
VELRVEAGTNKISAKTSRRLCRPESSLDSHDAERHLGCIQHSDAILTDLAEFQASEGAIMVTLHVLGKAEIVTGVATITPSQEKAFAAGLHLVLERGKRVSRTRLASLLWPEVAEKVRAHRLRQAILQLKKLGIVVRADRDNLQVSQHDAQCDLDELTQTHPGIMTSGGSLEFLPGYSPRFSEPFRDWIDSKRDEVHATATRHLLIHLDVARRRADWVACDKIANQCCQLDPFNETAVLAHAEATAMRGAKKEAIGILDRYVAAVGETNQYLTLPASLLRRRIVDRVQERTKAVTHESVFVGRNAEMETLIAYLGAARSSKGGACLITGQAGIGKSRLTSELVKFAELDGIQTEWSTCRRSDLDRPLSVFVDLVPRLRELPGALGCSQETLSVLKRLTEFDGRVTDTSLTDDSTVSYAQIRRALFDLFDAITDEQCLLIVLDDVQWLDRSSVKLLSAMVPWATTRKLFFVLNERASHSVGTSRISQLDMHILPLSPLEPAFAKSLVGAIVDEFSEIAATEVINRLLSVGEGNPFFLEELGKQWLETGKQHEFPPSISAVVGDRLSRLSCDALQVLQTCAILGVNATIDRVERVLEYKSHQLLSAVQELSVAGMLQEESDATADISEQVNPRHDLLSSAALGRLAPTSLAFLHRRAGTVLERETVREGASTSLLWACAFHWGHAGDRERAFGVARSCAEHLLEVGLPFDASQAFERVLDYCVTDDQRFLVLSRLAVALQVHGQWERSIEVILRARQIRLRSAPSSNSHDDLELALFDATWRGSLENSTVLRDICSCVESEDASASHRVACGLLGLKVASNLTQIGVMKQLYRTIRPLFDDPVVPPASRFEIDMVFHSVCGDVENATEATKHFLEVARADRNLLTFSRALGNAAVAHRLGGRREAAERLFIEALDHSIAHGLTARASFAAYSLVRLYLAAGDVRQARRMMARADLITQSAEDVHLIADRLYLTARISLEEGNIQDASAAYAIILTESRPSHSINRRAAVLALGIRIGIFQSASSESLWPMVAALEAAHLLNRSAGWQDFEAHALFHGLTACGKRDRGRQLLTEYWKIHRREKGPLPQNLRELLEPKKSSESSGPNPRSPQGNLGSTSVVGST